MEFKIYKADGELLGTSFAWIFADEYNDLSIRQIVRSINHIHKKYLKKEFRAEELCKLKTAYLTGAETEIGKLADLDILQGFDWSNEGIIKADDIEELFGYYDGLPTYEVLYFDLLYKLILTDGVVTDIDYFLAYLPPESIDRQHLRRITIKKGSLPTDSNCLRTDKSLLEEIGIDEDDAPKMEKVKAMLGDVIATLTPLEQKVIVLRYGLRGETKHTLYDTATELNIVTTDDVWDIEKKALRKLRHPFRLRMLLGNSS